MTVPASPDVLGPATTRVLVALLAEYAAAGRASVRTVAARAGRSLQPTHLHLRRLEKAGLVAGLEGRGSGGRLRPACIPLPLAAHAPGRPAV